MMGIKRIDGSWKNERGSIVVLRSVGSQLNGTYRTAGGKPSFSHEFDLVGVTNGDLISFSVAWIGFDSLTTWVGRYEQDSDTIYTLWHLVRSHDDACDETGVRIRAPVELWKAFNTQASRFTRMD